jgi:hypothetical protein
VKDPPVTDFSRVLHGPCLGFAPCVRRVEHANRKATMARTATIAGGSFLSELFTRALSAWRVHDDCWFWTNLAPCAAETCRARPVFWSGNPRRRVGGVRSSS